MRRARADVIERAEHAPVLLEIDAGLLPCLANRGVLEIAIRRVHSAARARYVATPRVALGFGTLDHEKLRRALRRAAQDQRDGGEARDAVGLDLPACMRGEASRQGRDVSLREEVVEHGLFDVAAGFGP